MSEHNENADAEVVKVIRRFAVEHGHSPTVREICDELGYASKSTGQARIARLIREGALRNRPGSARTLTVTPKGMVLIGGTAEL